MFMKKVNNYMPILTCSTKQTFLDYVDSLDIPEIDYFAIGIQNLPIKRSISLMSSEEWQKHFSKNEYANYDPLRRAALHSKRDLIPFQEIDYVDNFGKEIMRQRGLMGIKNGIVLVQRFPKVNYMITLGTGFSKFDAFDFIKHYHDKIALIKNDFISLVQKDAKQFLPKEIINSIIHPSSGAK